MNSSPSFWHKLFCRQFFLIFTSYTHILNHEDNLVETILVPFWRLSHFRHIMEYDFSALPTGKKKNQYILDMTDYSSIWDILGIVILKS